MFRHSCKWKYRDESVKIQKLDSENKNNLTWKHVSLQTG